MKFSDKDDKIFILAVFGSMYHGANKTIDYTTLSNIDNSKVLIVTLVIFLATLLILSFTKILKKHTGVSFIAMFAVFYITISTHLIDIQHYYFSEKIQLEAKVIRLHTISLKDDYTDKRMSYDRFTIETENKYLNDKEIYAYDKNNLLYYTEVGDTIKIEGTISENMFKVEKFNFISRDKKLF